MKALVLGGGSLKGAWQVGALQAVLDRGFVPEMIYGISAGALNASFLVNETGKQLKEEGKIDWNMANKGLIRFWMENITKPEDVGVPKSYWSLGLSTMFSRFDGFIDVNPLHEKIKKEVNLDYLRASPIRLKVGAVNVHTGELKYVGPEDEHFIDYLFASSAIPLTMPAIQIGHNHKEVYIDGGLRAVIPVKEAVADGATDIVGIATHPENPQLEPINYRSLLYLLERIKNISVYQLENNDIEWAQRYNENLMSLGGFSLNKKIDFTIIRPNEDIPLNLIGFNRDDIKAGIKQGFIKADEVMSNI